VIVERPENQQAIGSRFVLRNKFRSNGTLEKKKARLVARGFSQRPGVDYGDTFAPVARIGSIRLVASLAARLDLELRQFDITTAYLNGNLTEDVYMEPPKHIEEVLEEIVSSGGKSCLRSAASKTLEQLQLGDKVFLLKKALYGLRQAGRCWYERLRAILYKFDLTQSACNPCVFYLGERENLVIVVIYVDDIIVAARRDCDTVGRLYAHLSEEFEVKDFGLTKYCLGIEFSQKEGKITMNQRGYVDDLLKRFGMVDSKPVATPMSQGTKLARNEKIDSTQVDVPYRELVGALMYLSVCTRPDIAHAASYLSQFNNCYDSDHWTAAKRVLRYLKGTRDVGLIYGKTSDPLTGFVDADWANCEIDRKSYIGFAFILAGCPIS